LRRVILLRDYNTRVVLAGTTLLGCAAGVVGSFTLLRRRALMGDALSHATLPGIAIAFMVGTSLGLPAKSLPLLLAGATVTGLAGVAAILLIRHFTRLKEDTALGAVLSVFFGAGIALLGMVQQTGGHAAGLESFIYGKTASMGISDAMLIAVAGFVCVIVCAALYRELKLLCFDQDFARAEGYPVTLLDLALMALVVTVCMIGLQAAGLILVIALLVIPAAAARFWTDNLWRMILISALVGGAGGAVGAAASAVFADLPSGAIIVLACSAIFLFSLVFGSARGFAVRKYRAVRLNRSVGQQHLLRAMYEIVESRLGWPSLADKEIDEELAESVAVAELLEKRTWSPARLRRELRRASRAGWLRIAGDEVGFQPEGLAEAARLTRLHRLWELYLIHHADVAPGHVDREADAIEHVLDRDVVAELEMLLERRSPQFPASPHSLVLPSGEADSAGSGDGGNR
jgi:manganese/zinc/iron transport system permease protein